ncbi:MAG: hypothetical protein ACOCZ6_02315 [Nanoarchaeota archaeon]
MEKRKELQELYTNCYHDPFASNNLRAKILLQEQKTYGYVGNDFQFRQARYMFDYEKAGNLVYMMAVEGLLENKLPHIN